MLPVVIGGSTLHSNDTKKVSLRHPLTIIVSLTISIIAFTLLLKASTALLGIPTAVWSTIAGGIILLFGINLLFPVLWEKVMVATGIATLSNRLMGKSQQSKGIKRDILLGSALGPIFNSCSPTYALIVAVILPASFVNGLGYLIAYSLGLGSILLLIAIFGRIIVSKLKWASNPRGLFQKIIGVIFIIVGLAVMLGLDKMAQTFVLENGLYDPIMNIERNLDVQ